MINSVRLGSALPFLLLGIGLTMLAGWIAGEENDETMSDLLEDQDVAEFDIAQNVR